MYGLVSFHISCSSSYKRGAKIPSGSAPQIASGTSKHWKVRGGAISRHYVQNLILWLSSQVIIKAEGRKEGRLSQGDGQRPGPHLFSLAFHTGCKAGRSFKHRLCTERESFTKQNLAIGLRWKLSILPFKQSKWSWSIPRTEDGIWFLLLRPENKPSKFTQRKFSLNTPFLSVAGLEQSFRIFTVLEECTDYGQRYFSDSACFFLHLGADEAEKH